MVPPIRSMPRTPSRVSGRLFAAMLAGSAGSIARTPSQPRRKPITSQPSASAERVIERMQGLSPGTSPPPVSRPIRMRSGRGREGDAQPATLAHRDVHLGTVENRALPRLQLRDGRRDRPAVDGLAGAVADFGAQLRDALDRSGRVGDPPGDAE